jgi:hypothetical protein
MPFRHWYVVVTLQGREHRIGPYATRLMAQRKASGFFKGATLGEVTITYEIDPKRPHRGRS